MSTTLTRLGHSFFRIETAGKVILVDPWITGNPSLAKGWETPERYADVDYVLVTHGHFDHVLGVPEVCAASPKALVIAQFELALSFMFDGVTNVLPTNIGSTIDLDGIKVSAVAAAHSAAATDLQNATISYRGTPMGYVIEGAGGFKVYAAGDTGLTADMKFVVGDFFKPDVAILPIDGLLTMSPEQAVYAAKQIKPKYVVPAHDFPNPSSHPNMAGFIDQFPFVGKMLETSGRFAELMAAVHGIEAVILGIGDAHTF